MGISSDAHPRGGFTLVEVLIAIIILAVGILGLAALQMAGMRTNHSAYLRTQATIAAADLIDRMRVTPEDYVGQRLDTSSIKAPHHEASDAFRSWAAELERVMPSPADGAPSGEVDCTTGSHCNSGNCEIIVRWNDARAEIDPAANEDSSAAADRSPSIMSFRVCTRLAGTR